MPWINAYHRENLTVLLGEMGSFHASGHQSSQIGAKSLGLLHFPTEHSQNHKKVVVGWESEMGNGSGGC